MDSGSAKAKVEELVQTGRDWVDIFRGTKVAASVEAFGTVYGDILLGMHREIQSQKSRIQKLSTMVVAASVVAVLALIVAGWALWIRA